MSYQKGVYLLELFLQRQISIQVGRLGSFLLVPGYYYYCGSAQGGLNQRLGRYVKKRRTRHWHIDYLMEDFDLNRVFTFPGKKEKECQIARLLEQKFTVPVTGFASSDCSCRSHLFYNKTQGIPEELCMEGKELLMGP